MVQNIAKIIVTEPGKEPIEIEAVELTFWNQHGGALESILEKIKKFAKIIATFTKKGNFHIENPTLTIAKENLEEVLLYLNKRYSIQPLQN